MFHVLFVVKEFEHMGHTIEDLISIGTIGLIKAINEVERAGKVSCSGEYVAESVKNEISTFIKAKNRNNRKRAKSHGIYPKLRLVTKL